MSLGEDDLLRIFEQEETYLSADVLFNLFGSLGAGGTADLESAADDFAGAWIDYSSELGPGQDDWQSGGSDDLPVTRSDLSEDGIREVRGDQDVWVYQGSAEGRKLVVEANPDAPLIATLSNGDSTMNFSDWNVTMLLSLLSLLMNPGSGPVRI